MSDSTPASSTPVCTSRSVPADSVKAAAVGVCLYTAWVAGVALIGSGYDAELAYRGRLELVTDPMPAQAYPAAAEGGLSLPKATELIRSRLDQASASAWAGLRQLGAEPGDGGRPSALLRLIRRAHATATAGANPRHPCRARAGRARSCRRGRGRIGRIAGPPWAADQRRAAAAAWAALS